MRDAAEAISAVIESDRILTPEGLGPGCLAIAGERIAGVLETPPPGAERIDARGRLVLPGVVDIHGDAFERQIMPRPGTAFPLDIALLETDRQLVANGITTAFHGVTVSWEPGLRGIESARAIVEALGRLRPRLGADTRLHIRWETFALDCVEMVEHWLDAVPTPILALNDHTTMTVEKARPANKLARDAERAGLSPEEYRAHLQAVWARRAEVPRAIERMGAAASKAGAVLLAHDERTVAERERFRALGAVASEFPMTRETAAAARAAGEHTVLGAPNVLRGGSHNAALHAGDAVRQGLCTVLASDYYYPAPLLAAFRLIREGMSVPQAWALVSANATAVAGLGDRGGLAAGRRADILIVDDADPALPRVASTMVAGRTVYRSG
ncbi:MAG: alpha-D-ribose 1-methylphosphonate 5-triphosphate diphosphatase [Pseudomonadota bacterium]